MARLNPGGGGPARPKARPKPSRPLVLAPRRAPAPKPPTRAAFRERYERVTPSKLGAQKRPKPRQQVPARRVESGLPRDNPFVKRAGWAAANQGAFEAGLPRVRSTLRPLPPARTEAQIRRVVKRQSRAVAELRRAGFTTQEIDRIAGTDTPAGAALRQAQRAQNVGGARALRREGAAELYRQQTGKRPSPRMLARFDSRRLSPQQRRDLERVGRAVVQVRSRPVKEGHHATISIGPATIDISPATRALAAAGEHVTSGHGSSLPGLLRVGKNLATDVRDFPVGMVKGTYELGAAGFEALPLTPGGTDRAKRLWKGYAQSSFVPLMAQGRTGDALNALVAHPLYGALDLAGVYGLTGRAVGGAGRLGALGKSAKAAMQLERADLRVTPTIARPRTYSKNAWTQGFQKAHERSLVRQGLDPNQARESMIPFRGRSAMIRRDVDAFTSGAMTRSRMERELARRDAVRSLPTRKGSVAPDATRRARVRAFIDRKQGAPKVRVRGRTFSARPEQAVLPLVIERAARSPATMLDDLATEAQRLEALYQAEGHTWAPEFQRLNRQTVSEIGAFLRDEKASANVQGVWDAAQRYAKAMDPRTRELISLFALEPDQALAATVRSFAVTRGGTRFSHDKTPFDVAVARHDAAKAAAGQARVVERAARDAHSAARQERARLAGVASVVRGKGSGQMRLATAQGAVTREQKVLAYIKAVEEQAAKEAGDAPTPKQPAGGPAPTHIVDQGKYRRALNELDAIASESLATQLEKISAGRGLDAGDVSAVADVLRAELAPDGLLSAEHFKREGAMLDPRDRVHPSTARALRTNAEKLLTELEALDLTPAPVGAARAAAGPLARQAAREAKVTEQLAQAGKRVEQTRIARTDAKKARRDAEVTAAQFKPRLYRTGLVDAAGKRVSTADVLQMMRDQGVEGMPSFITHSPSARGARAYFRSFISSRETVDKALRTGEARRRGAVDHDPALLQDSLVNTQTAISNIRSFDQAVHRYGEAKPLEPGQTHPDLYTLPEAKARIAEEAGTRDLVAVRVGPARYGEARIDAISELLQRPLPGNELEGLARDRVASAFKVDESGQAADVQNIVLMERSAAQRLQDQMLSQSNPMEKVFQKLTGVFRGTVLPFSTKWITGNVLEAMVRSLAYGITPRDNLIGRRILRELYAGDEQRAAAFDAAMKGGLFFGSGDTLNIYRDATALAGTGGENIGRGAGVILRLPLIRQGLAVIRTLADGSLALNKWAEQQFQLGVIGKLTREEIQKFSGSWIESLRAQEAAVKAVADGMNADQLASWGRKLDEILGQYSRFSPSTRHIIQTWAPFLPWYLNAVRFVYWTLPVHHPVKTALLANTERVFQQEWEDQAKQAGTPPGDLRAALRMKDGGYLPLARYTPSGAFTGEFPGILTDPFLPQFQSVYEILNGRSWTKRDLQFDPGKGGELAKPSSGARGALALYAFLESTIPLVQIARRLREGGRTPYDNSTVWSPKTKPGTAYGRSALERVFYPFSETYLKRPSRGGGSALALPAPKESALEKAQGAAGKAAEQSSSASEEILKAQELAAKALEQLGSR